MEIPKSVEDIYNICCDYFKEDLVDIQPYNSYFTGNYNYNEQNPFTNIPLYSIIIKFPSLTIVNELDEHHDIEDLYVSISITSSGSMINGIYGLRSTITETEFKNNYWHSHLPWNHGCVEDLHFLPFCLGSGPITFTCSQLTDNQDEMTWRLFCAELDKYVRVESLDGGPYRLIKHLNNHSVIKSFPVNYSYTKCYGNLINKNTSSSISDREKIMISLAKELLQNNLIPFYYNGYNYKIRLSYNEFIKVISDYYVNNYCPTHNINMTEENRYRLADYYYYRGNFYNIGAPITRQNRTNFNNHELFTFKNNPIKFLIKDDYNKAEVEHTIVKLLNHNDVTFIYNLFLFCLNIPL